MEIELRALPFDVTAINDGDRLTVSGIVNRLGSVSEILTNPNTGRKFRETIEQGVFTRAIQKAQRVDFLSMHDKNQILSSTDNNSLELRETPQGLQMDASISGTSWGRDTYQLITDGIIKGMSFGMKVLKQDWSMGQDGIPLRTIKDIDIFEVSAVRSPAYKSSSIEARDTDSIVEVDIPNDIEERDNMTDEERAVKTKAEQEAAKAAADKKAAEEAAAEEAAKTSKKEEAAPTDAEKKAADEKAAADAKKKKEEARDDDNDTTPTPEDRSIEKITALEARITDLTEKIAGFEVRFAAMDEAEEAEKRAAEETAAKETELRSWFVSNN